MKINIPRQLRWEYIYSGIQTITVNRGSSLLGWSERYLPGSSVPEMHILIEEDITQVPFDQYDIDVTELAIDNTLMIDKDSWVLPRIPSGTVDIPVDIEVLNDFRGNTMPVLTPNNSNNGGIFGENKAPRIVIAKFSAPGLSPSTYLEEDKDA